METKDITPVLASADTRARGLLASGNSGRIRLCCSGRRLLFCAKDSLAAALEGERCRFRLNIEQNRKKEHPLLSFCN